MPNPPLRSLLAEAYSPCHFFGQCKDAQWKQASDHILRGFVGASGAPEDVELMMVFSEPDHPHDCERHDPGIGANGLMQARVSHAYDSFKNSKDLLHRIRLSLGKKGQPLLKRYHREYGGMLIEPKHLPFKPDLPITPPEGERKT